MRGKSSPSLRGLGVRAAARGRSPRSAARGRRRRTTSGRRRKRCGLGPRCGAACAGGGAAAAPAPAAAAAEAARRQQRLRQRAAGEPGVDQVELVGREVEALAAAARHHEVAEAAGEQVGRGALLEPGVGLAHHLQHEAHVVAAHAEARAPARAG